jgi:hypothetical protein
MNRTQMSAGLTPAQYPGAGTASAGTSTLVPNGSVSGERLPTRVRWNSPRRPVRGAVRHDEFERMRQWRRPLDGAKGAGQTST